MVGNLRGFGELGLYHSNILYTHILNYVCTIVLTVFEFCVKDIYIMHQDSKLLYIILCGHVHFY